MAGRVMKLVRVLGVSVVALLLVLSGTIYAMSQRRIGKVYDVTPTLPHPVSPDSATLARGEHLSRIANCILCHADDLGGGVYVSRPLLATVVGPNLTTGRGGVGAMRSDSDLVRAIRHGVRADRRSLVVMPSEVYVHMGDRDLASLLAYIRHRPPIDRELPATGFGPVGRALVAAGKLDILVAGKTPALPIAAGVEPTPTAEYGRYLAGFTGCHGCHGEHLSGGRVAGPPDLPLASNLTPSGELARWSEEDFARALRQGRRPDGRVLNAFMPSLAFVHMTDAEVHALWLYLRSVPPRPFGQK